MTRHVNFEGVHVNVYPCAVGIRLKFYDQEMRTHTYSKLGILLPFRFRT